MRAAPIPALGPAPGALKPFWPPALLQQAPPAIILAAMPRFRGPALFRGLRPCPSPGASFWPSGLTLRSSGPAFCGPLTLAVRWFQFPVLSTLLVALFLGLVDARHSIFGNVFPFTFVENLKTEFTFKRVSVQIIMVSGSHCSNLSLKPTRFQRAAYFGR